SKVITSVSILLQHCLGPRNLSAPLRTHTYKHPDGISAVHILRKHRTKCLCLFLQMA
ncbi:hypothetical protein BDY19DRAFT_924392, partial [Irpex rosettiformis]